MAHMYFSSSSSFVRWVPLSSYTFAVYSPHRLRLSPLTSDLLYYLPPITFLAKRGILEIRNVRGSLKIGCHVEHWMNLGGLKCSTVTFPKS
ncbi:hypothetical protein TorRG33x02_138890 [Trema orientale]|uniref:Uncharacterized protein n=1 Tax=Trema orientale TaxID=63057 RepID=A0A2P5EXH5_TREOI|nr:hypothetical protein TorRG33x02_138890 [Trema orientale]